MSKLQKEQKLENLESAIDKVIAKIDECKAQGDFHGIYDDFLRELQRTYKGLTGEEYIGIKIVENGD